MTIQISGRKIVYHEVTGDNMRIRRILYKHTYMIFRLFEIFMADLYVFLNQVTSKIITNKTVCFFFERIVNSLNTTISFHLTQDITKIY